MVLCLVRGSERSRGISLRLARRIARGSSNLHDRPPHSDAHSRNETYRNPDNNPCCHPDTGAHGLFHSAASGNPYRAALTNSNADTTPHSYSDNDATTTGSYIAQRPPHSDTGATMRTNWLSPPKRGGRLRQPIGKPDDDSI